MLERCAHCFMNKLLILLILSTFVSCHSKESNKLVAPVLPKQQIDKADTLHRKLFLPSIDYNRYQVDTFSGNKASLNLSSNPTAQRFHSAITWSITNFGSNFSGHYNLARWGCGTNCINGAITDLQTGLVYDIPPASLDYQFRSNSRLLVINPPDSSGYFDDCSYCKPELWLWNDIKKMFEKLN